MDYTQIITFKYFNTFFGILCDEIENIIQNKSLNSFRFRNLKKKSIHYKSEKVPLFFIHQILNLKIHENSSNVLMIKNGHNKIKFGMIIPENIKMINAKIKDIKSIPHLIKNKLKYPMVWGLIEVDSKMVILLTFESIKSIK